MEANPKLRVAAIVLLVIGAVLVVFFGMRTFHAARGFHGPPPLPPRDKPETDVELIRDWMTVPFIARTYHVPGFTLFHALNIPPEGNEEKSLLELNRQYYPSDTNFVLNKIKETIRTSQPSLPPDSQAAPTSPAVP